MALVLDRSNGLEAKTGSPCSCHGRGVWITGNGQDVWISEHDFAELVKYFLTNTALHDSGPEVRLDLVKWVAQLQAVRGKDGWRRLAFIRW